MKRLRITWTRQRTACIAATTRHVTSASNRIGREVGETCEITFYGTSFIAGPTGEILADAGRDKEAVITATVDLDAIAAARNSWGLFRDRRPDLYGTLQSLDGKG